MSVRDMVWEQQHAGAWNKGTGDNSTSGGQQTERSSNMKRGIL
jgi:hypothetical protein